MDKRKRRVKRIKIALVALFFVFLLLPSVLCCILFYQMHRLSGEVEELKRWKVTSVMAAGETELPEDEGLPGGAVFDSGGRNSKDTEEDGAIPQTQDNGGRNTGKKNVWNQPEQDGVPVKTDGPAVSGKAVYLTFDDGPSRNTEQILEILAEYGVHATFFVVGKTDKHSLEMYRRIVEEGHTLGMHSYSHSYEKLYASLKSFRRDFEKLSGLLEETTGVTPLFYRFPGGSSNTVSEEDMTVFISYLEETGVTYYDWNVVSGDAVKDPPDADTLYENVMAGVGKHEESVVLMHDLAGKETTIEALPKILTALLEEGVAVLPIGEETVPIHHKIKAPKAKE